MNDDQPKHKNGWMNEKSLKSDDRCFMFGRHCHHDGNILKQISFPSTHTHTKIVPLCFFFFPKEEKIQLDLDQLQTYSWSEKSFLFLFGGWLVQSFHNQPMCVYVSCSSFSHTFLSLSLSIQTDRFDWQNKLLTKQIDYKQLHNRLATTEKNLRMNGKKIH